MNSAQQRRSGIALEMSRQTSVFGKQSSTTSFEHLSNEIIYEIFEFLAYCHAYDAFYDLNIRFQYLIIQSPLPLKLDLSNMSKEIFENYCRLAVTPNQHRIKSLRISNRISIDYFLVSFSIDTSFIRLEALTLNRTSSNRLTSLLTDLASLPHLASLTITTDGLVQEPDVIHQLIFALPVLQYCNTSFDWHIGRFSLSTSLDKRSAIKHLVIDGPYGPDNFSILLSYIPQLVRLSCCRLSVKSSAQLETSIVLANLTHLHLDLSIPFSQFEKLISSFFHRLEVLHISSLPTPNNASAIGQNDADNLNTDYLHADRWQQLISIYMPRLRSFDLQCFGKVDRRNRHSHHQTYRVLIDKFDSLFWIERGWLFAHQHYEYNNSSWLFFHSVHPLRSNGRDPCQYSENEMRIYRKSSITESARQIIIADPLMAVTYTHRHSHPSRLTLSGTLYKESCSFVSSLSCMVPMIQLTELVLTCDSFRMNQLIELLQLASNVRRLMFLTYIRCPIFNDETIHLVNNADSEEMPHRGLLTLKHVQALIKVCPRLQSLEMAINESYLELIVRFLLLLDTSKTHRLCLLGLRDAHHGMIRRLHKTIDAEKLIEQYTVELISNTAYLWW